MDIRTALANIEDLLLGPNCIPVQLRSRKGLNMDMYNLLVSSIEVVIEEYKNKENVPKRLALAFVDIGTYFYFGDDWYPPKVQEELEDAAHELISMAYQIFE